MVTIQTEQLKVCIHHKGAEIASVTNKQGNEFIWQANPTVWPRHAPILFPIVGKLKNDQYHYQSQTYNLPQHGFARDMAFELISNNTHECVFELKANTDTIKKYPFDFVLQVNYQLHQNTLVTKYLVRNPSKHALLFAIGAHPGFNCSFLEGETISDFVIEFEKNSLVQSLLSNGLLSGEKKILELKNKTLPLSSELFANDALVFEGGQIHQLTLRSLKSHRCVSLYCTNWPYFGVWTKKDCEQFICLEPWHGVADSLTASGAFEKKEGIIELPSGEQFNSEFAVTFG